MILDRMHLINFKRFKDTEINFKNGITGIVGMNGTGKSSIVDAVFFTLYGVSGGLASDFIVSSFANGEKCEVGLHFRVGSEAYYITRTFKKGKTVQHDATLTCNEGVRASGVSQVDAEVRRILGMGPVDFRNTVYAAQKDLMTLLDLTPGKRREWFLRALGIDYLNTGSQKILKEQCDVKEKEATLLQGELAAISRQDPAELEQVRLSITGLKDKIIALQAEENRQQEKRAAILAEKLEYDLKTVRQGKLVDQETTLRNDITELTKRIEALTGQAVSLNVDEQDLLQLDEAVKEIPKAREEIENYRTKKVKIEAIAVERRSIATEIRALDSKAASTHIALDKLDRDESAIKSLYDNIRQALHIPEDMTDTEEVVKIRQDNNRTAYASLSTTQDSLTKEKKKLLADLQAIKDAGSDSICPLCRRPLNEDDIEEVLQEYDKRLTSISDEYEGNQSIIEQLGRENRTLSDQKPTLAEIQRLKAGLQTREFHGKDLATIIARMKEILDRDKELISQQESIGYDDEAHHACQQQLIELEKAQNRYTDLTKRSAQQAGIRAQIAELNSQITSKTTTLAEVKAAIDANPINLSEGPRLTHEVEKLDISLKTITQDLTLSIEREHTATQKIADLELAATRIGTVQQQLATLKEEIEVLKLTRTAIADYVVYIMQVVRSRIESEVSSIISEITGGKYDQVLIDEDFNLLIRENDREYTVDRFSGGEQDDIAVALRIALSRYLAELHQVHESTLLIFDEIFGSQDEERRANLLTALRSQESRFPQIILISHIAEIQGEFENTLIVQGNGPVSTVRAGA